MHPFVVQQLAAQHVKELLAEAGDARRARQARRARSRENPGERRRPGRPGLTSPRQLSPSLSPRPTLQPRAIRAASLFWPIAGACGRDKRRARSCRQLLPPGRSACGRQHLLASVVPGAAGELDQAKAYRRRRLCAIVNRHPGPQSAGWLLFCEASHPQCEVGCGLSGPWRAAVRKGLRAA